MQDHRKSSGNGRQAVDLGFGGLTVSPSDHIGHFYRTRKECRDVLTPFLKKGLEVGDQCIFHLEHEAKAEIRKALTDEGVNVESAENSGQLVFSEGLSDPEKMQKYLSDVLGEIPGKFPLLRWGGDMSWSFKKIPDTATLMEWETLCNVMDHPPAVFLCQYDLTRFIGSVVVDAMKTHPITIVSNAIHENPYYQEPETFLEELRSRPKAS